MLRMSHRIGMFRNVPLPNERWQRRGLASGKVLLEFCSELHVVLQWEWHRVNECRTDAQFVFFEKRELLSGLLIECADQLQQCEQHFAESERFCVELECLSQIILKELANILTILKIQLIESKHFSLVNEFVLKEGFSQLRLISRIRNLCF